MKTQIVLDLCSGIGGFTLGGMISGGFQTIAFCEINEYCQAVLSLRFPNIPIISDLKDVTTNTLQSLDIHCIDGITAGLPCPAFSVAGKQLGSQANRNLFPEFFRILCDVRPRWAIVENVPGLLTVERGRFFAGVLRSFAECGYDVRWSIVSAASVGAVHRRERLWIVAYSRSQGRRQRAGEKISTIDSISSDSNGWQWEQLYRRNREMQEGSVVASFLCSHAPHDGSHRCQQQLETADTWGQIIELGDGDEPESFFKSNVCIDDDGISTDVDGCLLRHGNLEEWLIAATIPIVPSALC